MHIDTSAPLSWSSALKDRSFKRQLLVSTLLLVAVLTGFFFILQYAENRDGITIEKGWLKNIIASTDFSGWIFTLMYGATVLGIFSCFRKPGTALLLIRTYLLLQSLRAFTLLLVPLNPPEEIIPLQDPFLDATFYNGRTNLKDLFFSGHVATLVMFIPIISNKWIRLIIALAVIAIGIFLVAQRVHYIVDVIAAPVFAIIAFLLARRWGR